MDPQPGPQASFRAAQRASYGPARPWRSAAVGPKRPGHDETVTSWQNSSFGLVSARSRHRYRHQSLRQGKRSPGELKSLGRWCATPTNATHCVLRPCDVRCALRSARSHAPGSVCASSGWGGGPSWLLGGGVGRCITGLRPSPGQGADPPRGGLSGRPWARVGSSLKKQKVGLAVYTPQTQNDRLPLRASTSHSGRVQRHYPHYKWGSITPRRL